MTDMVPVLTVLAAALFAAGAGVALGQKGRERHGMDPWVLTGFGFVLLITAMGLVLAGHIAWVP